MTLHSYSLDNCEIAATYFITICSYIFWTDWAPGEPSVSRAAMDGSDVRRLFVKPVVSWPNGITIDHIAERIYWVDAKEDYIASADLEGHKFRKVIMNNVSQYHVVT